MSEPKFVRHISIAWWLIQAAAVTAIATSMTIGVSFILPEQPPLLRWIWLFLGCAIGLILVLIVWILPRQSDLAELVNRLDETEDALKKARSELNKKSLNEDQIEKKQQELQQKEKDLTEKSEMLHTSEERLQIELKRLQSAKDSARQDGVKNKQVFIAIEERERKLKEDEQKLKEEKEFLDSYYLSLKQKDEEIYSQLDNLPEEKKKLEDQIGSYRHSVSQLESEIHGLRNEQTELFNNLSSLTQRYYTTELELAALLSSQETYHRELEELKITQSSLRQQQVILAEQQSILTDRERDLEERERDLLELNKIVESKDADAQAKLLTANDLFQKTEFEFSKLRDFRERLWANSFQYHDLSPSTQILEQESQNRKCNAAMLLAFVHLLGTIQEQPSLAKEFNLLWPCLRGIGRFLVSYLQEQGEPPESIVRSLKSWAAAMNEKSQAQFELWVPTIGESFKASSMDSQSGPIDSVSHVLNWAVSKSNSIMASKAEVS